MRWIAIRGGLAVAALAALAVAWLLTAQWWSLLVDRVYTAPMVTIQSTPFGWNGTYLQFGAAIPGTVGLKGFNDGEQLTGAHLLELTGPGPNYKQTATLEIDNDNRLVLAAHGGRFVLGTRVGTIPGGDGPIPAFAAEPGDKASLLLEQSLLGWPAPFTLAVTLLSGPPTIWMRHLYYRLAWTKASGAMLAMVWRCEQGYDGTNGWHNFGYAELIRVEISPAR